mmetsp:Transcript_77816/g.140400  ORF Transcript_77816/g.140400 Transcript_77816/m.140400 type:complete len:126 (+) Transcript_77816:351-728(+)
MASVSVQQRPDLPAQLAPLKMEGLWPRGCYTSEDRSGSQAETESAENCPDCGVAAPQKSWKLRKLASSHALRSLVRAEPSQRPDVGLRKTGEHLIPTKRTVVGKQAVHPSISVSQWWRHPLGLQR